MQTSKKYKCLYCNNRYSRNHLITHIDRVHEDMIPEGYTSTRLVFDMINKNTESCGHCRICGRPTKWSESSGRYEVLCERESCRRKYKENLRKNVIRVQKTTDLFNDPEHQQKMISNRKISGMYDFADGGSVGYVGNYEKKFLKFCDEYMQIPSWDISQGPVFEYEFEGSTHQYYSDFIYIPYNLIIEVKDGGDHPNTMRQQGEAWEKSGAKTIAKEKIFTEDGEYNYIRLTDNQFYQFVEILMDMKYKIMVGNNSKTISINSFTGSPWFEESTILQENTSNYKYNILPIKTNKPFWALNTHPYNMAPENMLNLSVVTWFAITMDILGLLISIPVSAYVAQTQINAIDFCGKIKNGKFDKDFIGTDVVAVNDGIVVAVEDVKHVDLYKRDTIHPAGNYVVIQHDSVTYSLYAHLKRYSSTVKVGDRVARGQKIAEVGLSGNSNQPHLHFQMCVSKPHPELQIMNSKPAQFGNFYYHTVYNNILQTYNFADPKIMKKLQNCQTDDMKYTDEAILMPAAAFVKCGEKLTESTILEAAINEYTLAQLWNIKENYYYRFTCKGEGIYEAYKKRCTKEEWQRFLKSSAATWLPKPDKYITGYYSYFTGVGACYFMINTVSPMVAAGKLNKDDIELSEYKAINRATIVYQDKYQIVLNRPIRESTILETTIKNGDFNDVKNIVDTLTKYELDQICNGSFQDSPYVKYRRVAYEGKEPVAFIDCYQLPDMDEDELCIVVACKKQYRNRGITKQLVNKAKEDLSEYKLKYEVKSKDNKASISVGKSVGLLEAKYSRLSFKSKYIEPGDLFFNMDKLNPNDKNILYITGMSGGGKTTLGIDLAKELHCNRVELDYIQVYYMRSEKSDKMRKCILEECPEAVEFFDLYPFEYYNTEGKSFGECVYIAADFVNWFTNKVHGNGKIYIVNGAQLTIYGYKYFIDKPIIIKDVNWLKTMYRRTAREYNPDNTFWQNYKDMIHALKVAFRPGYIQANIATSKYRRDLSKAAGLVEGSLHEGITYNKPGEPGMLDRRNIRQLNNRLNQFGYGYIVNGKVVQDMDLFYEYYRTIPIRAFERYKVGVCWDYVNYEDWWFTKENIKHQCYFIVQNNEELATHTFLVYEDRGMYYYFESSWKKYAGVWEYSSLDSLFSDIVKRHLAQFKPDRTIDNRRRYWAIYQYWPFGTDRGLRCDEFMKYCATSRLVATNNEEFAAKWFDGDIQHLIISVHEGCMFTESVIEEKANYAKPKKCKKCGSTDIGVYLQGEPVFKCKNCGAYLGTVGDSYKKLNEAVDNEEYVYEPVDKVQTEISDLLEEDD